MGTSRSSLVMSKHCRKEPVDVFVLTPLPGMAGLGKTGMTLKFFCECFMPCEPLSIVIGDSVDEVV